MHDAMGQVTLWQVKSRLEKHKKNKNLQRLRKNAEEGGTQIEYRKEDLPEEDASQEEEPSNKDKKNPKEHVWHPYHPPRQNALTSVVFLGVLGDGFGLRSCSVDGVLWIRNDKRQLISVSLGRSVI